MKKIITMMLILACYTSPAQANFWNIIDQVTDGVNTVDSLINRLGYTNDQFNELLNSLGVDSNSVDLSGAKTQDDVAIRLYQQWYANLSPVDQEIANQLIIEYATGIVTSREELAISSWFQSLSTNEQLSILGMFAKFEQITNLVEDKPTFLVGVLDQNEARE